MHLHSGWVFVQWAFPSSCYRHHISETQLSHSARTLHPSRHRRPPPPKERERENEPRGDGRTEVTTNQPSKSCQITHTTYKYFRGHNNCHILQWKGHRSGWTVKLAECFLPSRHQRWVWNTDVCYQWPPWQNGKCRIFGLLTCRYLARL